MEQWMKTIALPTNADINTIENAGKVVIMLTVTGSEMDCERAKG